MHHGPPTGGGTPLALVQESVVLTRGLEAFLKPLVVLRSLAQLVFQGGVLGDESLDGVFGEVEFKVSDLAEELPDAGPLAQCSARKKNPTRA